MRGVLISVMTFVAAALVAAACTKPIPISPTARTVYGELVEAGCLADTDSGLVSVQEEYNTDAAPPWFGCLWDGGNVSTCNTPCSTSGAKSMGAP